MQRQQIWQVEVAGNVYETDFAGLTQWIAESSLLPEDKIRRDDMPWIQAKLVPSLAPYFGGKSPLVSENVATSSENFSTETVQQANTVMSHDAPVNFGSGETTTSTNFAAPYETQSLDSVEPEPFEIEPGVAEPKLAIIEEQKTEIVPPAAPIAQVYQRPDGAAGAEKKCALHPVREAEFACRQCLNIFCSECPRTIARVRLCPMCGDMCNAFGAEQSIKNDKGRPSSNFKAVSGAYVNPDFSFADFKAAWSYPFRFPLGLLLGGIVTALMGIGIYMGMVTASIGGLFPGLMTMLVCGVVSVAIVYGSATKAVNQIAYGNMDETFMPSTEDFSIWDTILLPCFLGLATCVVSWGPMVLIGIMIFKTISGAVDVAKAVKPDVQPQQQNFQIAPEQPKEVGQVDPLQKEILGNSRESEANAIKRIQALQKTTQNAPLGLSPSAAAVQQQQQQAAQRSQKEVIEGYINKIAGKMIPLVLLLLLALLWGIFYFPTALTVAGYTESIGSTMNPLVGFGMMRQMGSNYFKAFGTYLLLLLFSFFIYMGVGLLTAPLAAIGFGQAPAQFIANIVSFYLYIVTACIFGLALYRSHEKLGFSVAN